MEKDNSFIEDFGDDPFEEALKSVKKNDAAQKLTDLKNTDEFEQLKHSQADSSNSEEDPSKNIDLLLDIEVDVYMEIGRSSMHISDLLLLGQSSVIELDRLVGDDLELVIGNKKIGIVEVVISQEKFAGRIKRILSHKERLNAINS